MSTSTVDRAEINRRNAARSTGPRTAEGKSRSRLNALKHGMTASLPVLPGENADMFQARVDGWVDILQPRNDVEQFLVVQAAETSWQLERVKRAHVARLTDSILEATSPAVSPAEKEEVVRLGRRLYWDRGGPIDLYPNMSCSEFGSTNTSWSRTIDDPDDPARLVVWLESTLTGCEWMIERWGELRGRLVEGQCWNSSDKLMAIRLLGKQPCDAINEADVATIFLATHTIAPRLDSPFGELGCELVGKTLKAYEARVLARAPDLGLSGDPAIAREQAREILMNLVDGAIGQLNAKAEAYRQTIARRAAMAPSLLGFDASVEGERLRRYETSCTRLLLRTLADFNKLRLADSVAPARPRESAEYLAGVADSTSTANVDAIDRCIWPSNEYFPNIMEEKLLERNDRTAVIDEPLVRNEARPTDCDECMSPAGNSVPDVAEPAVRNEARTASGAECMSRAGNSATGVGEPAVRNEARPPSGAECMLHAGNAVTGVDEPAQRNEAMPSAGRDFRVESEPVQAGFPPRQRKRNFGPVLRAGGRKRGKGCNPRPERVGV